MHHRIYLYDMFNPLSLALFQTVNEGPFEEALVGPYVLPETVRFSVSVIADVDIAIVKNFCSFPMLD